MPRILRPPLVTTTLALALAVGLPACGATTRSDTQEAEEEAAPVPRPLGGTLTQLSPTDVDTLDPGGTYGQLGFQVVGATHRTLYTIRPGRPGRPVPDLAADDPEISRDARTVTVRLRRGVRFAPPVSREVVAADVRYAIERHLSSVVGRPYPHFAVIDGASARPGPIRRLRGITTPDPRTIVFRLRRPVGASFAASLVMPATAPVPPEYAREHDAGPRSTYGDHVVATGPYRVAAAPNGDVVGRDPGREIRLVRNPAWSAREDDRPARVDRFVLRTDARDVVAATRRVLRRPNLLLGAEAPAETHADLLRARPRTSTVPAGGYRFLALDVRSPALRDLRVRRAVLAAYDRAGALRVAGGRFVGEVATHFLPPGVPGHGEGGGVRGVDPRLRVPGGDEALAARLLRSAGFRAGKVPGTRLVLAGPNAGPGRAQAEFAAKELEALGFRVRLRRVPADAFGSEICGGPTPGVDVCAGVGWFRDFDDPSTLLEPRFRGGSPTNISRLAVPSLDRAMAAAERLSGEPYAEAWGEIDRRIVALAAAVPLRWERQTIAWSRNVRGAQSPYHALADLAYTARRRGG